MFPSVYGVVSQQSAANWWEAGGATGAVAVYQPIGAADLSTSYNDLSGNGNNATPGVAPTWDAVNGWKFSGTQYLNTGIVPTPSYSMAVRYTNATIAGRILVGQTDAGAVANRFVIQAFDGAGANVVYSNSSSGFSFVPPGLASGVLAISGASAYRNGIFDIALPADGIYLFQIVLGGYNAGGTPAPNFNGNMQAFAIYNNTLSAAQVAAISAAMAAL